MKREGVIGLLCDLGQHEDSEYAGCACWRDPWPCHARPDESAPPANLQLREALLALMSASNRLAP